MAIVAPSILSADMGRLHEEVKSVLEAGAPWIHCDIMDGRFVPNLTFGAPIVKAVSQIAYEAVVDCHLMIVEPEKYVEDFVKAGAEVVTVHAETCVHLHRNLQQIRGLGARAGVALNPHTPPEVLEYVLEGCDLVLVMSVNPGFGGQSLIESALRKLEVVRKMIDQRGLSTLLEVDGGVKPDNARRFTSAGADVLVSGSGVFNAEDRAAAIAALREA